MDATELRQLSRRLNAAARSGGKYLGARARELARRVDRQRRDRNSDPAWLAVYWGRNMHGPGAENAISSALFWRDKAAKGELI